MLLAAKKLAPYRKTTMIHDRPFLRSSKRDLEAIIIKDP